MNALRLSLCSLMLLIVTLPLMAQGTYTQIDFPGASSTYAVGINGMGDLSGYYNDVNGTHGFVFLGGGYTSIDYPGATDTFLFGMNDQAQVVGYTSGNPNIAFVYDTQNQSFSNISFPNVVVTDPEAINDAGVAVGSVRNTSDLWIGFQESDAGRHQIAPPGSLFTVASGITSANEVVGYFEHQSGNFGNFSFLHGKYHLITIPNALQVLVLGISPTGTALVGQYMPIVGTIAGFIYQNNTLTTLQFPGAKNTWAVGISDAGLVVGQFSDSQSNNHGFLWTPPAHASKP